MRACADVLTNERQTASGCFDRAIDDDLARRRPIDPDIARVHQRIRIDPSGCDENAWSADKSFATDQRSIWIGNDHTAIAGEIAVDARNRIAGDGLERDAAHARLIDSDLFSGSDTELLPVYRGAVRGLIDDGLTWRLGDRGRAVRDGRIDLCGGYLGDRDKRCSGHQGCYQRLVHIRTAL